MWLEFVLQRQNSHNHRWIWRRSEDHSASVTPRRQNKGPKMKTLHLYITTKWKVTKLTYTYSQMCLFTIHFFHILIQTELKNQQNSRGSKANFDSFWTNFDLLAFSFQLTSLYSVALWNKVNTKWTSLFDRTVLH